MRAWLLRDQAPIEEGPLELTEVPDPEPGAREIVIGVKATGICRTDLHIAEGDLPLKRSSLILGHEIVGTVEETGESADRFSPGDRVGVTWLHSTCGRCGYCRAGRENLCPEAEFTGWDVDGGFSERTKVPQEFALPLPDLPFQECAPLMCPGVAGYRSFRLTGAGKGMRLGLYGFGITGTYVLQVAKRMGAEVYVVTRSEGNKEAARRLGADWVGGYDDPFPTELHAGIIFPAVGELVPIALEHLRPGGRLVLAPVTMTPIVVEDFNLVWGEREIRSLAHVTRRDGEELMELCGRKSFQTRVETFPFEDLQDAMIRVKRGEVNGNAVVLP
ncbi:MAG: zinc-binding alcohol dehydrogenase family protein [Methanomassiliicoccales archaeon]